MADAVIDTNPPAQVAPSAPAPPMAAAIPAPATPPDVVQVVDPTTGQTTNVPVSELLASRNELNTMKSDGLHLYQRAIRGDSNAAREYLDYLNRSGVVAPQMQVPTPQVQQPVQQQPVQPVMPPHYDEVLAFYQRGQSNEVVGAIGGMLQKPEYAALAMKPTAVTEVVDRLNMVLKNNGGRLTPQDVNVVLGQMNAQEVEYQKRIVAPYLNNTGEPGVTDPFRGGYAEPGDVPAERPDMSDQKAYTKWLGARFRSAMRADDLAKRAVG